jgi:hypothetical protein
MLTKIVKIITMSSLILAFNSSAVEITECMTSECVTYFKSFKKASHRGHKNAMYNLGKFFHYGFGTPKDEARALNYYKKAGMRGVREAEYSAGKILLTNKELYDFDDAVKWLERASRKGQPNAAFLLGQSYFNKKSYAEADTWLTMVYETHPVRIVNWIKETQQIDTFNQQNLPTLHSALEMTPVETFDNITSNDMEVITVTGYYRNNVLDAMLAGFRKKITSTGTRLPNITCDQNVACAEKSLNEMKDSMWVSQK